MSGFTGVQAKTLAVLLAGVALLIGSLAEPARAQEARQQAEIHALIREIDYLIDYSERLATRYANDRAPIRFDYDALLIQLRLTRDRAAAYLNETHETVEAAPPLPATGSLTRRR